MGNKQTIFTDEQLDAYQVRQLGALCWKGGSHIRRVWARKQPNIRDRLGKGACLL